MAARDFSLIIADLRAIATGLSLTLPAQPLALEQDSRYTWDGDAEIRASGAREDGAQGGGLARCRREMLIRRGITIASTSDPDTAHAAFVTAQDRLVGAFIYEGNLPADVNFISWVDSSPPIEDLHNANHWIVEVAVELGYEFIVPPT